MKKTLIALIALAVVSSFGAEKTRLKGAAPGEWTQDYEAAVAQAKRDRLPVLLKFTGSDWCGWCILMEKRVFAKPDFLKWANDRLYLVTIDQPNDASLVPAEYKARNRQLFASHGIRGVPRYEILDPDGAMLGALGASRDATVASFTKDVEKLIGPKPEPKTPAETPALP